MSEAIVIDISAAMGTRNGRTRRRNSITTAPTGKGNLVNYAESHLAFLNKKDYCKKKNNNTDIDSSSCADEHFTGTNDKSSNSSNVDQYDNFNATFLIKRRGSLKFCKPRNTPNRSISISLPLDAHRVKKNNDNDDGDDQDYDHEDHRKYSANSETMIKLLKQECTTLRRDSQILIPTAQKSSSLSSSSAIATKTVNTLSSLVKQQQSDFRRPIRKTQKSLVDNDQGENQELRQHQSRRSSYPAYMEKLVKDIDFKQTKKLHNPNHRQSISSRRRIVRNSTVNTTGRRRSSAC